MFIQRGTNQIELPVFSRTCRSDLELRCHEMVNESVLPFTGSLVLVFTRTFGVEAMLKNKFCGTHALRDI